MKYILPVFLLLLTTLTSAQTPRICDSWSPALAGSVVHITITEHQVIAIHPREGFAKALPDFMALPSSQTETAQPMEVVHYNNFSEEADTIELLKVVYDSAKTKGRLFIRLEKGKDFILPLTFLLRENGEAEIGIAPGSMNLDRLGKAMTLKQVERATRPSAKHKQGFLGLFGFEGLTFTFYNSVRTAEFTKMKDPASMPKEELIAMINSFGNRMAADLQSLPVDTSSDPLSQMALFGPIFKKVFHTAGDLFIAHGYNPLGAAAMYDRIKDDSDIKAAVEMTGKKIEESVPALREAKVKRELQKAEYAKDSAMQATQISATDSVTNKPVVPAEGYEMEKRMTPAQQTPQVADEFIEVTKEPAPKVVIQSVVEYPKEARYNGIEGTVTFSALIGKDGAVQKVVIDKSDNDIFNQAVIDAVKKTEFKPAMQEDKPVRVWYTQKVVFKLHSGGAVPDPNSH
ncbi:MAG: energy transducer TonB [Candidatus Kapaibacterium sp.]